MSKKKNRNRTNLPIPAQGNDALRSRTQFRAISFQGPIPPPHILKEYDTILPGSADRILSMAERQSAHRQELEKKVIESDVRDAKLGLYFGFIIGLVAIICGVICAIIGKQIAGASIGGTGVIGLVSVFIYGSVSRKKEREAKNREMVQQQEDVK